MILQGLLEFTPFEIGLLYFFFFMFPIESIYKGIKEKSKIKIIQGLLVGISIIISLFVFLDVMARYRKFEAILVPGTTLRASCSKQDKSPESELQIKSVGINYVITSNKQGKETKRTKDFLFRKYNLK